MHFTTAEITGWLGAFLWPFFRVSALVMAAPITGSRSVPTRIRLVLALAITLALLPTLPPAPAIDPFSLVSFSIIFQQILIGVAMGFALQLVFNAVITGGQVIAMQAGLGFASMVDPQNGVTVPVISQLLLMVTTLVFLAMDGHLVLIQVLAESFQVLPIAPDGLTRYGFWAIAEWGRQVFAGGLWMALPVVASMLVVKIAFGVVARATPQFNIFSVGFIVFIVSGFMLLIVFLPTMVPQFLILTDDGFDLVRRVLSGGP
jgi:flagellar biosynthetic protein FliR